MQATMQILLLVAVSLHAASCLSLPPTKPQLSIRGRIVFDPRPTEPLPKGIMIRVSLNTGISDLVAVPIPLSTLDVDDSVQYQLSVTVPDSIDVSNVASLPQLFVSASCATPSGLYIVRTPERLELTAGVLEYNDVDIELVLSSTPPTPTTPTTGREIVVTGLINIDETDSIRGSLPSAEIVVRLLDVSRKDAPSTTLGVTRVPASEMDDNNSVEYSVSGAVPADTPMNENSLTVDASLSTDAVVYFTDTAFPVPLETGVGEYSVNVTMVRQQPS